jgi:hypothetical protein
VTPADKFFRNQITILTHTEANDISQCKVIPMGRMGCGGPGKYIVYSTKDTNVFLLKTLISTRNIITFPIESLSTSICAITPEPSSFSIVGGKCNAEYETYKKENNEILGDSFTFEMYGNYTSSGASRVYNGELNFLNNELINGFQNYNVWEGSICKDNCKRETNCVVKDNQWVDKITEEKCTIDKFSAPLTKEEIDQQIKEGKLIPSEDIYQCHNSICYKIKNILTKEIIQPFVKLNDPYGRYIDKDCKIINGCNGAHCVEKSLDESDFVTTCEFWLGSICYKESTVRCEKQDNSKCGWTDTFELKSCIDEKNKL